MAKNGTVKWASIGLAILILVGGLAVTWGVYGADIAQNGKDIVENGKDIDMLDTIVCDPKDGVVITQAIMMERQKVMQKKVDAIEVDTKLILEKLN